MAEVDTPFPYARFLAAHDVEASHTPVLLMSCGSYNPIHTGHVEMMEAAKRQLEAGTAVGDLGESPCRVVGGLLSPVNDAYKKPGLASFQERFQLCDAALADSSWLAADPWEGSQPEYQRSYLVLSRALREAKKLYSAQGDAGEQVASKLQLAFVCGADLFESFYTPGCWNLQLLSRIFGEFFIVAVARAGSVDPREKMARAEPLTHESSPGVSLNMARFTSRVTVVDALSSFCPSSTEVRRRVAEGQTVKGLVPDAIVDRVTNVYASK